MPPAAHRTQSAEASASWTLRNAHVLDQSGSFSDPLDVVIIDGVVASLGSATRSSEAADVDCTDIWLMPGVFDCHDHVAFSSLDIVERMHTPITEWTLEAATHLEKTLRCGVTFVRDAGGADAGIRRAIERGITVGPHLQLSVTALCETGGHFDGFLAGPGLELSSNYLLPDYPGRPPYRVDGTDEMRRAARELLRAGADWIKICTTGGITSEHTQQTDPEFSFEEIAVAVFEAQRKGKAVMAHAFGGEGLDNALAAGVRSIEHGIFLTEAQAARMAAAGCWFVPTLAILHDLVAWAKNGEGLKSTINKSLDVEQHIGEAVRIAQAAGVPVAVGTDFVRRDQHGNNLIELLYLQQAGLSVEQVLLAATAQGAALCGVADTYGRIAPGYVFDVIALDEAPGDLTRLASSEAIAAVFKNGTAIVANERFAIAQAPADLAPAVR